MRTCLGGCYSSTKYYTECNVSLVLFCATGFNINLPSNLTILSGVTNCRGLRTLQVVAINPKDLRLSIMALKSRDL